MKDNREFEKDLVRLFGSTSRARTLRLLFANERRAYYQREIVFETGVSLQAVQRELKNLVGLQIITRRNIGSRAYYQIDPASPFYHPLKGVCGSSPRPFPSLRRRGRE